MPFSKGTWSLLIARAVFVPAALALILSPARADVILYVNGAPNHSDGANITGFVGADDFTLSSAATLTGGTFWSSANSDPFGASFSGTIGWAILTDSGGTPGTILASGSDSAPVLTDTGVQIFGTEEWRIDFSLGAVNLGQGTYWLALHESPLGAPDDGTTIYWDTTGSQTGSLSQITADVTGASGWSVNSALDGGSGSGPGVFNSKPGTNGLVTTPEPSSVVELGIGMPGNSCDYKAQALSLGPVRYDLPKSACRRTIFMIRNLIDKARLASLAVFLVACGVLSFPEAATEPIQIALQNSRLASFDVNCFLYCFPSDNLTINIEVHIDNLTKPGLYEISINSALFNTFTVNTDHTLANPDSGQTQVQTFAYGPVSNSGNLGILIISENLVPYLFNYPIVVSNQFVFDFYWTFLGIPAESSLHSVLAYNTTIPVYVSNPPDTDPPPPPPCHCGGMTGYSFNLMQAGIVLSDTPLSYNPPHGAPMNFTLTYNQRDVNQPAVFSSSNVGPQWTFNGLTYISAGPVTGQIEAVRYLPGGGQERYRSYTQSSSNPAVFDGDILTFLPNPNSQAVLQALTDFSLGNRPNYYQLTFPDGTVETYNNNAGGGTTLYITQRVDPQGNITTFNYATNSAQLLSITDALGQQTTFSYDLPDTLKITKVTDPFGRSTSLTYDSQGRLTSITDPVGIVSSFTYDPTAGYVNTLTTPYGTTTFLVQDGLGSRVVQATDPLGETERVEYQDNLPFLPAYESAVPSAPGLTINNANLNSYNSFYWGRKAYADAVAAGATPGSPAFYNFAKQTHWALGLRGVTATPSSEKMPLESRVWYNYHGQSNPDYIRSHGDHPGWHDGSPTR